MAALSGLALWLYGYGSLDLVLFAIGIAGLVLQALCTLAVAAGGLLLARRLRGTPPLAIRVEASRPLPSGFSAPGLGAVPLLKLSWVWREPPGTGVRLRDEDGRLHEDIRALHRGIAPGVVREFTVGDAFGLARVRFTLPQAGPVTILPDKGALETMPILQAMSGGDALSYPHGKPEGDRLDIRAYGPGDSVRHILWKVYARTRELNVRTPERAIAPTRRMVAYLLTGPDDEAAAAAARVALETGILGPRWAFGADGSPGFQEDQERALLALARSGTGAHPPGLIPFLDEVLREGQAHCLAFVPPRTGPWVEAAAAAVRRYPGTISFVVGTDGVRRPPSARGWRRLVLAEDPDPRPTAAELTRVLHTLAEARAEAVVVDRQTGRLYGEMHRERLEAMGR